MPGVNSRLSPPASAALMVAAESPGCATKNRVSGIELPGPAPPAQVMPAVLVRSVGTNTWYAPPESTYRNGFSRTTGACPTTVYGGFGKLCAGAPATPTNTLFQTAL